MSPSIGSLERIARALGVTLVDLFRETHGAPHAVVRAAARPAFTSEWSRARVESLSSAGEGGGLEALAVTLAPSGTSGTRPTEYAYGQFVYQLRGTLTLFVSDERIVLRAGDSTTIPPNTPHRWQNDSRRLAQVLLVFGKPARIPVA